MWPTAPCRLDSLPTVHLDIDLIRLRRYRPIKQPATDESVDRCYYGVTKVVTLNGSRV